MDHGARPPAPSTASERCRAHGIEGHIGCGVANGDGGTFTGDGIVDTSAVWQKRLPAPPADALTCPTRPHPPGYYGDCGCAPPADAGARMTEERWRWVQGMLRDHPEKRCEPCPGCMKATRELLAEARRARAAEAEWRDRLESVLDEPGYNAVVAERDALASRVAALEEENEELKDETRCPECGCATPAEADGSECGCIAPVCVIEAPDHLAALYNADHGRVAELEWELANCRKALDATIEERNARVAVLTEALREITEWGCDPIGEECAGEMIRIAQSALDAGRKEEKP